MTVNEDRSKTSVCFRISEECAKRLAIAKDKYTLNKSAFLEKAIEAAIDELEKERG